ncbi:unnamed protein product [Ostreobium quekettii]|uniref:Major facilitator superfamily (MFS) profile domain-containing protein n=1 Tax=Ostreobium quekettii TaxID=121088 RepID=A0A8S1IKP6_9CHLO|nr:unnamed protein product [Ostreobium quekettii]|eukprot:evm.model.scf_48.4 EVM.evm.TU.scf_48.4   scf_48:15799-21730(-)
MLRGRRGDGRAAKGAPGPVVPPRPSPIRGLASTKGLRGFQAVRRRGRALSAPPGPCLPGIRCHSARKATSKTAGEAVAPAASKGTYVEASEEVSLRKAVVEEGTAATQLGVQEVGSSNGAGIGMQEEGLLSFDFSRWPRRWTIVGLCCAAFMLCNMDRVNMSISILPMSDEFQWNSQVKGLVQSSFFWGYLLTQIVGGIWADRFGGKKVLAFGVVWWSMATALTPLAASAGLPYLLAARACMGVGEGVAMPAMNNLLSRWIPQQERSRSLALVYSGMFFGSIAGLSISPHMIQLLEWPSVFYTFGSMGLVWYLVWQRFAGSNPKEDILISEKERKFIMENNTNQDSVDRIPWALLLSKKEVWAIIVCHFCHNWGTFILLTWTPTYYNQVLGMDLMSSGLFSVLPWITMAVCSNFGGWIADSMVQRGMSVTAVRKVMQSIGFLGPAFFLTQLGRVNTVPEAVACMMCSQGLDAFSQSGLYSNHQDIGPKYAGVLLGMSNTAGVLAGVMGTYATGHILQSGTWDDVWGVAVALYLTGTVIWNLFSTGERVFE